MSTHTPGPWRVEESSHKQEFSHWIGSLSHHVMPRQSTIAGVVNAGAESDANARLIAAPPDLLAALTAIVAVLQKEAPGTALNHHTYDAVGAQAHAAIAKAKGTR